jgi:hypothetical protein
MHHTSDGDNSRHNNEPLKLRGRIAIDNEHKDILKEDERRMNIKISNMYGVDQEEAREIHINYHIHRISSLLFDRAKKHGMTDLMIINRIKDLNIIRLAYMVSEGELIEMAAADILYKELCTVEEEGYSTKEDRYINFYG